MMKQLSTLTVFLFMVGLSSGALAQNVCAEAWSHVRGCEAAFCEASPASPLCPFMALGEDSCDAESIPAAEAALALSCEEMTADWPTEPEMNVCMRAQLHVHACEAAFCEANPASPLCPFMALGVDSCEPEFIPGAEAALALSCEEITADWATEPTP